MGLKLSENTIYSVHIELICFTKIDGKTGRDTVAVTTPILSLCSQGSKGALESDGDNVNIQRVHPLCQVPV